MVPKRDLSVLAEMQDNEDNDYENEEQCPKLSASQDEPRKLEIVYFNLVVVGYWYFAGLFGLYLAFTSTKWSTLLFSMVLFIIAEIGVTAGSHRLWSHKAYKAKLPLQIILMLMTSIAFQETVIQWARDHRLHHKYSDTHADPNNSTRGAFYAHVGWLLVKRQPETIQQGKCIPLDDLRNNPVLRFQKKYALPFIGAFCFIIPTLIPVYFWEETLVNAWHTTILRYALNLNATFLVNSLAHRVGCKPYDKNKCPTQNLITSLFTFGEGFHNYHHTFPCDYRAAELGNNSLNLTTKFIDFFAWIGWAYDLKTVPKELVENRAKRTGDGTDLWGQINKDITKKEETTP